MNDPSAIARTVLYEGFALYPYRASALKNRRRILFGTLWPEAWREAGIFGEPSSASTELLLRSPAAAPRVHMSVRYLCLEEPPREVEIVSTAWTAERVRDDIFLVRATVSNTTPIAPDALRDDAEPLAMGAAHVVLTAQDGEWLSAIDPPADLAPLSQECIQRGLFPILLGPKGTATVALAAPIILYDYPEIAPESVGDLFDATEIEEVLSLRIHTLTDGEKAELRRDPSRRRILERVESLSPDTYARMHGTFRDGVALTVGTRVTLRPRARADAFDVLLRGLEATVESIEHTVDGGELVCVTIDRDPGRDLGKQGLPGHRFFFRREEMEVLRA